MVLSGNLKDFGLTELVQMMGGSHKSGLLHIECEGLECFLYFVAGHLVHAECDRLEGEEAFFRAFRFADGRFSFLPEPRPNSRTIFTDLTALLIEAARLSDEDGRESHTALPEIFTPEELSEDNWGVAGEELESWELPHEEVEPSEVVELPQAEPSLTHHPRLLGAASVLAERLRASPATADFGIFSRDTLLKSSNPEEYGLPAGLRLDGRDPESEVDWEGTAHALCGFADAAAEVGGNLGAGALNFALLLTELGERSMVIPLGGLYAAASLRPGARPGAFFAEMKQISAFTPHAAPTGLKSTMG